MLTLAVLSTSLIIAAQPKPANPACAVLTPQDVSTLIGSGAQSIPMGTNPGGATCMFQNGDRMITVLYVKQTSAEIAADLWASKKRIVSGEDVAGWGGKAYAGTMATVPIVGINKGVIFTEVKVIDAKTKPADLMPKLKSAMKAALSRL